jgi:S-adenosylmethionine:tRNA ribosyltransferase-isomerase
MASAGLTKSFALPSELEATEPPEARGLPRDGVRLLVSHLDAGVIEHARFSDLPRWLDDE